METLLKYPRTPHLAGSRLQLGDTTEGQVSLAQLPAGEQVWEEKLDGGNTGIRFSRDAELLLQSRGHFLAGGAREKQYDLFKRWANHHIDWLFDTLGNRYVLYGEWCYAKHTVFYDTLPHYFFEFDIYDIREMCYLGTTARHDLLRGGPVVSVPVIHTGTVTSVKELRRLIRPSLYKSADWQQTMEAVAKTHGIDPEQARRETDQSGAAEGLYLKVENDGKVVGRYKFIRPDFLQAILESGSHWNTRTILPNQLAAGVDIFG